MGISNPYRERIATIMAEIKTESFTHATNQYNIMFQRRVFVKGELRKSLIKSIGEGAVDVFNKLFKKEAVSSDLEAKQKTVEAKEITRVELSTFEQVTKFFVKTIEAAFGTGEEFSSNEVTDHLLTTEESISAYDVSRGGMYLFKYEPTTKNKLKYYDQLPLIIMLGRTDTGFTGLNVHYLPEKYRIQLLKRLFSSVDFSDVKEDEVQMRLNAVSTYKFIIPTYKEYKYDGISSRLVRIPIENWLLASLLPISKFQKESRRNVWDDSRRLINNQERRI